MTVPSLPAWIYSPNGGSMILEREESIDYYQREGWTFTPQTKPANQTTEPKRRGRKRHD